MGWGGGGGKPTMGISNFNLRRSRLSKRGKFGVKQSLIYTHPIPSLTPNIFPPSLQLGSREEKTLLSYCTINIEGVFASSPHPPELRVCKR